MTEIKKEKETTTPKPEIKKEAPQKKDFKYQRDKDREKVRGIFRFFEVPGGSVSFSFRKWKDDQVENYTFIDGEIYTIPFGVAHHLSNNCFYWIYEYKADDRMQYYGTAAKKKRRMSFEPLDFMDIEDIRELTPTDIETVTLHK